MKLRFLDADDLIWSVTDTNGASLPNYRCGASTYGRTFAVDPHPCYPHDRDLVAKQLAACVRQFPLVGARAELCSLAHEFCGRTNGLACEDGIYRRDDGTQWTDEHPKVMPDWSGHPREDGEIQKRNGQAITIVICGKRIPIHPAMTRYVVAHEYGHAAFYWAAKQLGYGDSEDAKLEAEYMRIREGRDVDLRGKKNGEKWHRLASEIIANDFRICVMGVEPEFWPHEVAHPKEPQLNRIFSWWAMAADAALRAGTDTVEVAC